MFKTINCILIFLLVGMVAGCSSSPQDSPIPPTPEPDPVQPQEETVFLSIGCKINNDDLSQTTVRSVEQGDLFGVNIEQYTPDAQFEEYIPYASGVFDDLDKIQFKFVKGRTYRITVNYTPDAKTFIYKYPNGTYGYPFSSIYGLQEYRVNEPVYDSGKPNTDGFAGEILTYLTVGGYQINNSGFFRDSYTQGTTKRFLGRISGIKINDTSSISVPLTLYTGGIKLNINNFEKGKIKMIVPSGAPNNMEYIFSPGDEMACMFWIEATDDNENGKLMPWAEKLFRIYYISEEGETFLLCTKAIDCQPAKTYVFNFNLSEREDGSIGITLNDEMTEENVDLEE